MKKLTIGGRRVSVDDPRYDLRQGRREFLKRSTPFALFSILVPSRAAAAFALNGTNQYLISSSALTPLTNFTVFVRVKFNSVAGNAVVFVAGDTSSNNENYILRLGSTEWWAGTYNGTGAAAKVTGLSLTTGVWYDIMAVFGSSTQRIIYNGVTRTTDTTNLPLTSTNRTVFGSEYFAGSPGNYVNGSIADMAIWGTALLTPTSQLGEVDALFKGASPRIVRPEGLTDYWPQVLPAGNATGIRGNVLTATNSNTYDASNPRIYNQGRAR